MQSFESNSFTPAMLIDTTDLYHLIPAPVAWILLEIHKVSRQQNLLASVSRYCSPGIMLREFKVNGLILI